MTTQSTIDKLIEMRLTSMPDAFLTQLQDARVRDKTRRSHKKAIIAVCRMLLTAI